MVREGYACAAAALAAGAAAAVGGAPWLGGLILALGGAAAWFFRDPRRLAPQDPRLVLSPADGRVVEVGPADPEARELGFTRRVAVFLSVFDVHVNRAPLSGRVERIEHRPGRFRAAFGARASSDNSRFTWWVRGERCTILFRQIAGVLARRIVAWKQPGDWVRAGERIGLIRLGSRVEVLIGDPVEFLVRVGDRVRAGVSPLARLPEAP
jgi:phosphatidylserine decarboxylase